VHAGAMSFEDALRVVKVRAEAMQKASDAVQSGMMSVLGMEKGDVETLIRDCSTAGRIYVRNLFESLILVCMTKACT
jgi:[acyl-carrier-protein] S-malonyltransferase